MKKVVFVGAGPGDPELITIKGRRALEAADIVIFAGSLVPKTMLAWARPGAELIDSSGLTLEEITGIYSRAAQEEKQVVRLHSGDPAIFGAIQEQIDWLVDNGHDFDIIPGVTAACAAAAAIGRELTLPEVSQTVILARVAGRTPVPEGQDLESLAKIGATLCLYLSITRVAAVAAALKKHYPGRTPVAIVYHAYRRSQKVWRTHLDDLAATAAQAGVDGAAVILVGPALGGRSAGSKLYAKEFTHGFRK